MNATIEAAVRSLVPNARFGQGRSLTVQVCPAAGEQGSALNVAVQLEGARPWRIEDTEILDARYREEDRLRRLKERVRQGIQGVLQEAFGLAVSPWGILSGVRPSKLVHSMLDRGFSPKELECILQEVYGVQDGKAAALLGIVRRQRAFFQAEVNDPISIYLGIPFCPTRCSYCSFAAYPLATHGHLLPGFLQALTLEVRAVGALIRDMGVGVESIYVGGGTPTTVKGVLLEDLLGLIRSELFTEVTREFTVEAGRPETLTEPTLQLLKAAGVDRISINPQTMHDTTLKSIGRGHSVEQVRTAFRATRRVGIPVINMDIILGLPGENTAHVEATLRQLAELDPDNLTVHSLALKRASRLKGSPAERLIAQEQGEAMGKLTWDYAQSGAMIPYYLYRQRYILGNLENIGYAKPGAECLYNIQMMEERQTILGLGGGAITKLVAPDLSLIRLSNPKCPATYSQQIHSGLKGKISRIRQHFLAFQAV